MKRRRRSSGSTILEFALAGVPAIFAFISVVQMGLAMWTYQSLAQATKELDRYIAVHGTHCGSGTNNCRLTVGNVATAAESYAIGLSPAKLNMTLISPSTTYHCNPVSSCISNSNAWPPSADSTVGTAIQARLQYQFNSALAMVWPGTKPVVFGTYNMGAYSEQRVLF
ncbi:MAG TPA: TadE family protein [Bryobacteraceae bacterium]|nr:TadE family protein [Bryobacteraceae bacterium]